MKSYIKPIILSSFIMAAAFFIILGAFIRNSPQNTRVSSEEYGYTITEYENNIAIIDGKTNKPYMILDVVFEELPERDKSRIKSGIHTNTLEEALSLAEDYE